MVLKLVLLKTSLIWALNLALVTNWEAESIANFWSRATLSQSAD